MPELLGCRDLVPVLGVSAEPLLGPIDLSAFFGGEYATIAGSEKSYNFGIDWLITGAERFRRDPQVAHALLEAAKHADSRGCLVLLGAILDTPGLAERLLQVLKPNGHSGENGKRKPDSNARGEEIL